MAEHSVKQIGCWSSERLLKSEKFLNVGNVNAVHVTEVGEVSLLLLGLLGEDVALESVLSLDLSCSGKGEPLFGTGISLNLGHFLKCL